MLRRVDLTQRYVEAFSEAGTVEAREQWKGEMGQYGFYVASALLGTVYYVLKGMFAVWSSGYFSADYDPLRPTNL